MKSYKKLVLIGGILGLLIDSIIAFMSGDINNILVEAGLFLSIINLIISFAITNAKAVGVLVLTISVIMLYITGRDGIVGFLLFLPGGIAALRYNEEKDDEKKRRKALAMLIDILDKIDTIYEWNERLHKLHHVLKKYEDDLPSDVRNRVDSVANNTDIQNLRDYLSSKVPKPPKNHKVAKILAATIGGIVLISGIAFAVASSLPSNQPPTPTTAGSSDHLTPDHQTPPEHHKKHHTETSPSSPSPPSPPSPSPPFRTTISPTSPPIQ
jgi:hypothetical protein